ncbi:MAG: AI-2E family transporter [Planctomycetota bacterium]
MTASPTTHRFSLLSHASFMMILFGLLALVYLFRPILVPISLALLLACLLLPATLFIKRILRVSQSTASILMFLMLGAGGGYLGVIAVDHLAELSLSLPIDISRLSSKIGQNLTDFVRDYPKLGSLLPEPQLIAAFGERNAGLIFKGLGDPASNITGLISEGLLTLILAIFFTVEQPILEPRLALAIGKTKKESIFYENLFKHLAKSMRRYLVVRAMINLVFGIAVAVALGLLKVNFAIILGVFAGLANFIPYLGQAMAALLMSLVALAQTGSPADMLVVILVFVGLSLLEGYLLTPIVMGRTMDLNGTTVLVSCLFWGFMWGTVGLFLATPIAAIIRLTLEHFPRGRKWALVMSVVPDSEIEAVADPSPPPIASI